MALLYADEDFDYCVVERLRQLGHDITTVQGAQRRGGSDSQVLAEATVDRRSVLTFNRWDFERLHRQNQAHAGIVSCTRDQDVDAFSLRIDLSISKAGNLDGKHVRVNRRV